MSTANPLITVMPDVQASLASLCVTFQNAIAASQTTIQQAALSSRENQQRALRQMQESLSQSLGHLARSSRTTAENFQNELKEAISSLNTRLSSLTPDQRAALIDDLSSPRLQTATRDYLEWLLSQSKEGSPHYLSSEFTVRLTISDSVTSTVESTVEASSTSPAEAFNEEYERLSPTTREVVEEDPRLKTLLHNKAFLLSLCIAWMENDLLAISIFGFFCSLALGITVGLYNKPDSGKPDKDS